MAEDPAACHDVSLQEDQPGASVEQGPCIGAGHIAGEAELDAQIFALIAELRKGAVIIESHGKSPLPRAALMNVVDVQLGLEKSVMRTTRTTIAFAHPVRFKGIDETFPAGAYELETDEEESEVGNRTIYRGVRTLLLVKTLGQVRTVDVKPSELDLALGRDVAQATAR